MDFRRLGRLLVVASLRRRKPAPIPPCRLAVDVDSVRQAADPVAERRRCLDGTLVIESTPRGTVFLRAEIPCE